MSFSLVAPGVSGTDAWHLSVDGMSPSGPNLSHWPGNRTPRALKADLSTGIALRFARAAPHEQERFLGGARQVLNDHYDTDGFLSLLAVLRPEVALAREETCLLAAATGDYQTFTTRRAFAIDRIVANLSRQHGPCASAALLPPGERDLARYRWLIEHAEQVLDRPQDLESLWREDLEALLRALGEAEDGALERTLRHSAHLSVLRSSRDLPRMVLNTLAAAYRVLHVRPAGPSRWYYRYHDRTESWFELVTISPPRRRDLASLAHQLQEVESRHAGADARGLWCADPPSDPIPELYFGTPGGQEYGEVTRELTASRLAPETVVDMFTRFLEESPA
jgi:hypothetical protein